MDNVSSPGLGRGNLQMIHDEKRTTGPGWFAAEVLNAHPSAVRFWVWGYSESTIANCAAVTSSLTQAGGTGSVLLCTGTLGIASPAPGWNRLAFPVAFGAGYDYLVIAITAKPDQTANMFLDNIELGARALSFENAVHEDVFMETNGLVSAEAENFSATTAAAGTFAGYDWTAYTDSNASGSSYMMVPNAPNDKLTNSATPPSLNAAYMDYSIQFSQTGTYYVWMRLKAIVANGYNDSSYYTIEGTSYPQLGVNATSWTWKKNASAITVSAPGPMTFRVLMRENGTMIDKIVLAKTSLGFTPSGTGPAETR